MRRWRVLMVVANVAALWGTGALTAAGAAGAALPAARVMAVRAAGSWGRAIEVPGLGALNKGGDAEVGSVSCASAGSCAAGGYYTDRRGNGQGFVVAERNGRWSKAIAVPGLGALNTGGYAEVDSLSCASAGNCAAGGFYVDSRGEQGFVVAERNGRWSKAIAVPGLGALNTGGYAEVDSVSCASAGTCVAGGQYEDRSLNFDTFLAAERNGRWSKAIAVPGLSKSGDAGVNSVSCTSAGTCAAGGGYTDRREQGFVVSQRRGRWGTAIEIPGPGGLNKGDAGVSSVSCASAGTCVAGGQYEDRGLNFDAFLAAERNGRWSKAIAVLGLAALNKGGYAEVGSVSCASAGNCAAGGDYTDGTSPGHLHGFVVAERNGRWGTAIRVPGLAALNKSGQDTEVWSVSCASAGTCAAGGYYYDRPDHHTWFVTVERNGRWGTAIQVPGLKVLNKGTGSIDVNLFFFSVSCAPAGACVAVGYYTDASGANQGFVTQAG